MKMVCLSTTMDIAIGLRLAGVQTYVTRTREDVLKKLDELSLDNEVGILNITEKVYDLAKDELRKISDTQKLPLIVKIPNS